VRALYLCKIGRVQTRRELAALLGYNESTLYRWFCCYQSEGLTGLLQVKTSPGKPSLLPDVLEGLRQRLQEQGTASTVTEIHALVGYWYNVQAAYQTVHGIVRYKLQSKLKLPRPVSTEANPDVQATFKKTDLIEVMITYFGHGAHSLFL